jgi:hypothetical protein
MQDKVGHGFPGQIALWKTKSVPPRYVFRKSRTNRLTASENSNGSQQLRCVCLASLPFTRGVGALPILLSMFLLALQ